MRLASRLQFPSLVLGAALLAAVSGLYVADLALSRSEYTRVRLGAVDSADLLQRFLRHHFRALRALRSIHQDNPWATKEEYFKSLAADMLASDLAFSRVWIADSIGRIQYSYDSLHAGVTGPVLLTDSADLRRIRELAFRTRETGLRSVSSVVAHSASGRRLTLIEPLIIGDTFLGSGGGTISSDEVLRVMKRSQSLEGTRLTVLSEHDTVVAEASRDRLGTFAYSATERVEIPGGEIWQVAVVRSGRGQQIRVTLWAIGLAMLGVLAVAWLRERQQTVRLEERSMELERLSTELLRVNRSKSEFLANVSHELRTPLNAIVGFVELLRDGVYGELGIRQVNPVDRIASSANHLRHLVDQVLDIAKMTAGRMEVHAEPIDLRPFVLDVASEIEALISERGLNLSIAIGVSLPRVRTDPTHLRQILVNLLGNAVKYTLSGGIAVRARLVPNGAATEPMSASHLFSGVEELSVGHKPPTVKRAWIALQVADSGMGIAPADRERIFEEFEQVNAGPRGDSLLRGTGLGLPISRRLARLLGGEVTVESEPGKGSTFTVWLPVDLADIALVTSERAVRENPPTLGGSRGLSAAE